MAKRRGTFLIIALLALVAQGVVHSAYLRDKWLADYGPKNFGVREELSPQYALIQLLGFREFISDILWVRADSFFESGNYDAVLPLIRLSTWLDPHNIDVFATGMWHLGYNFTDEEQRSDRRYIPYALALGKEGAEHNPTTYEMFFETGWMWYHKIDDDYENAVSWFKAANERPDMLQARRNLLSPALQRDGKVLEALDWYYDILERAEQRVKDTQGDYSATSMRNTIENNIDTLIVRMVQRGYLARQRNDGSYDLGAYDTRPAFDVGFSARVTVEEPRVIRVEGTWNVLPVGTRIRIILRDEDFEHGKEAGMNWDYAESVQLEPPADATFMQDQLYVRNRKFNNRLDMSKDPIMYPFKADEYVIDFMYNPRSAPPHIQDKFGFDGEGMHDENFLNTKVRPGQRVMFARLKLTRDQLLRRGEWALKTPVVETSNYVPVKTTRAIEGDILVVPGLRSEGATPPPSGGSQ